jgi:hypothetical protein
MIFSGYLPLAQTLTSPAYSGLVKIREELPPYWKRLLLNDIPESIYKQTINAVKSYGSIAEEQLAIKIMEGALAEYALKERKVTRKHEFNFRLYIAVICTLYQDKFFSIKQAFQLINYTEYCLKRIPKFDDNQILQFFSNTAIELLLDAANVPLIYWLQKISELNEIVKNEKRPVDSPIIFYDEFSDLMSFDDDK